MRVPVFSTLMMITYASYLTDDEVKAVFRRIGLGRWVPDTLPPQEFEPDDDPESVQAAETRNAEQSSARELR